jgi:hypothetical protein
MNFPTLTSGNLGALTFAHVNDVFRRIEGLESKVGQSNGSRSVSRHGIVFPVRIIAFDEETNRAAFVEVTRTTPDNESGHAWIDVAGGHTSVEGQDVFAKPLICSSGQVNSIAYVFYRTSELGVKPYYETIAPRQNGIYALAAVSGDELNGPRWIYYGYPAVAVASGFEAEPGWPENEYVEMYNTCEYMDDTPGVIGVGTVLPSGVTAVRQPIKVQGAVVCALDANGKVFFSLPNGYRIVCPS